MARWTASDTSGDLVWASEHAETLQIMETRARVAMSLRTRMILLFFEFPAATIGENLEFDASSITLARSQKIRYRGFGAAPVMIPCTFSCQCGLDASDLAAIPRAPARPRARRFLCRAMQALWPALSCTGLGEI